MRSLQAHLASRVVLVLASILLLHACGKTPAAPSPQVAGKEFTSLALTVPASGAPGDKAQLAAIAHASDGSTVNVTELAVWKSSSPAIATVSASGLLSILDIGDVEIHATYLNVSAGAAVHSARPLLKISGLVHEAVPTTSWAVRNARVDIVDGPSAGQSTVTDDKGEFALAGLTAPVTLSLTGSGYDELRMLLTSTIDQRLDLTMQTALSVKTETIVKSLCKTPTCNSDIGPLPQDGTHLTTVHRSGQMILEATPLFGVDHTESISFDLFCGSTVIASRKEVRWFSGKQIIFNQAVAGGCEYGVKVYNYHGGNYLHTTYQLVWTHPR